VLTRSLLPSVVCLVAALSSLSCQATCGRSDEAPVLWADGVVEQQGTQQVYVTTPIDHPWLEFPSHRRFLLRHDMGTRDLAVEAYLSYEEQPVPTGDLDPHAFAQAAGNTVLIESVDGNSTTVENDTCEDGYYLWLRLTSKPMPPATDN